MTHVSHVNPAATGAVYRPVACIECHPNNAGNNTHSNSVVNVTFAAATGANLGSYAATFVQGNGTTTQTTCATYCHGATMAAGFTGSVTSWTWNGSPATCGSCHGFPPTVSHTGVLAAATDCNRCHRGHGRQQRQRSTSPAGCTSTASSTAAVSRTRAARAAAAATPTTSTR